MVFKLGAEALNWSLDQIPESYFTYSKKKKLFYVKMTNMLVFYEICSWHGLNMGLSIVGLEKYISIIFLLVIGIFTQI